MSPLLACVPAGEERKYFIGAGARMRIAQSRTLLSPAVSPSRAFNAPG